MRTATLALAALLLVAGCSSSDTTKPSAANATTAAPGGRVLGDLKEDALGYSYRDVRKTGDAGTGGLGYIDVAVDKAMTNQRYRAIVDDLRGVFDEDRIWFVSIDCATGATAAATNRQANGRYAGGDTSSKIAGLAIADVEIRSVKFASPCPTR